NYDLHKKYTYDGPNQIYTVLLGDMIRPGVETEGYNHYSLIKTIEKNFGLTSLEKNDRDSNWFRFLWGEHFNWGIPRETPVKTNGAAVTAAYGDALYMVYESKGKNLCYRTFDGNSWSGERKVGQKGGGEMALEVCDDQLVLFYQDDKKSLFMLTYTLQSGWSSSPERVEAEAVKSVAAAAYNDNKELILAFRKGRDEMFSRTYCDSKWQGKAVSVGHQSDGDMTLAVLGPSIYLIYKVVGSTKMGMVSYNTADFNVCTVAKGSDNGPWNNTTKDKWSPSAFPVSSFSSGPDPVTPGEDEPVTEVYRGSGPFACATLDGVIHLAHPGPSNPLVLTETFSISGIMTPALKVSYNKKKNYTTSNGYGT
ncbi:MAG: hypothetical protein GY940_04390, partial [bacterium]|nr:hypothetical protein [bacterium]